MTTHPALSRRLFLAHGLAAAIGLSACGRTVLTGQPESPRPAGNDATTPVEATTAAPAGTTTVDVMGDYEIVDATTGTQMRVTLDDTYRNITANGLPNHSTGTFPNAHNPNAITAQHYDVRLPRSPDTRAAPTAYTLPQPFGIALNGVPFDPLANEFFRRDPSSGWQYDALGGGIDLGLDGNNAHVQPTGAYHYHGIPTGIVGAQPADRHGLLVGWAGDGFPIYVRLGYRDPMDPTSGVTVLTSSWRLRSGTRPDGPGGTYDGTFVQDWEYVAGTGDLDEANGRFAVTPEYPDGTYLYVLTDDFPVIPRYFAGTVDPSFVRSGPRQP